MKNKILISISIVMFFANYNLKAQVGGNQVYQNKSITYDRKPVQSGGIYSTDSTLVVSSKILLNQKADYYLLTIGVSQTGNTVIQANQNINLRIDNVIKKIKGLGIDKKEIYIDFISETKNYDHKVTDREIIEFFDNFNIRKNIIIKTDNLTDIDKIINYCSEEGIYDIVKVDYVSEDIENITKELFEEGIKIIQTRKTVFEKNSSIKLTDNYRLVSQNLEIYYPKNLYKQYNEAFESSIVNTYYSSNYIKKEVRKEKTFYYEGIETENGVDKIIDKISPIIGIQYIMTVKVIYELNKNNG